MKVLIKLIQGHSSKKSREKSEYCKFEVNGLLRDHLSGFVISDPASVSVKRFR